MMKNDNFRQALYEAAAERMPELLETPLETVQPSPELKELMSKSAHREKPKKKIGAVARRAAVIAVIAVLSLSALTVGVRAFFPDVWKIVTKWFEDYALVKFEDEGEFLQEIEEYREPSYLPEGYEKMKENVSPIVYTVVYGISDAESITYMQTLRRELDNFTSILDANYEVIDISVDNYSGVIGTQEMKTTISWIDEKYIYYITDPFSNLSSDDLLKIASSIYK